MKILLDECVPRKLSPLLIGHEVWTVPKAGLAGLENGKLLAEAAYNFDLFLTVDRNLTFQQNMTSLPIKVLVVQAMSNKLDDLKLLVPKILATLSTSLEDQVTFVKG